MDTNQLFEEGRFPTVPGTQKQQFLCPTISFVIALQLFIQPVVQLDRLALVDLLLLYPVLSAPDPNNGSENLP